MADYPLPNNACDLSGQVALVTGTTSGLGWRFARVLASAGASVALTGRRTERLDELAEVIHKDGGECASFRRRPSPERSVRGVPGTGSSSRDRGICGFTEL